MSSPYAQQSSGGGSAYAQPSSSGGSVYAGGSSAAPKPAKSRGFLGGLAHWVGQKADLAGHDLKAIPGGLADLGKWEGQALAHDFEQAIHHPLKTQSLHSFVHGDNNKASAKLWKIEAAQPGLIEHTFEHPLADPLQTVLTVAPVVGAAGRLGFAGKAAVEAGRTEGLGAAAKALVKKPVLPPRDLRAGDEGNSVTLHASRRPAVRAVQALHDRVIQKALDENPGGRIAKYAQKRIGGSLDETARAQQRLRAVPSVVLERTGHKLSKLEQKALELTSTQTTPTGAAAYHEAQAAKGVAVARNSALAKVYRKVDEKGLLTTNAKNEVIVDAAKHPKLAQADVALAKVQGNGDAILKRYGIRSEDELTASRNAPAQYRAGAIHQNPAPSARAAFEHDLRHHGEDLANEYVRRFGNVVSTDHARELSPHYSASNEARAAHAAEIHEPSSTLAKRVYSNLLAKPPAKDRTVTFTAGGTGAGKTTGLAKDVADHDIVYDTNLNNLSSSIKKIEQALASGRHVQIAYVYRHPVQALKGMLHRANRMGRTVPIAEHVKTHVGAARVIRELAKRYAGDPRVTIHAISNTGERGAAHPVPLDELPTLRHNEVAHEVTNAYHQAVEAGRVAPFVRQALEGQGLRSEIRGQLESQSAGRLPEQVARPGRGFVSYASQEKRAPSAPMAGASGPVVGEAKSPIISQANKGINIAHGVVPKDITGQAARHYRQIVRFVNTTERRNAAIRTGSDVRRSDRDVLVRVPGAEHAKIPQVVEQVLGRSRPTADDIEGLHAALDDYQQSLVPGLRDKFSADNRFGIGTSAAEAAKQLGLGAPKGYKWVDRGALGSLAQQAAGRTGRLGRVANQINAAVTAATVYFKIGHIGTRVLTNASTNIIQGSAAPRQIAKSVALWHELDDTDKLRALAASGTHGMEALPHEGTSLTSRVAGAGANWWARRIDSPFRFNSIAYEARKAGIRTPEQFKSMLDNLESSNPSAQSLQIAKRANREGIAYDRLGEGERRYIARAVWFYPWVKGTIGFLGNTILEHPVKSAALGAIGAHGRETQQAELGDVPSYEQGLFRLGGPGSHPTSADFSTFSPFATPADVADALARPATLSGFLNPVYGSANTLINGINQYGQKSKSPVNDALSELVSPTPEVQILNAYRGRHQDQSKRMFHKTWENQLARALVGPGLPRRVNESALHSAAAREKSGR